MNAPRQIPQSVRDAALDLINAAETLRHMREDTTDQLLNQRWEANRAAYQARREERA